MAADEKNNEFEEDELTSDEVKFLYGYRPIVGWESIRANAKRLSQALKSAMGA